MVLTGSVHVTAFYFDRSHHPAAVSTQSKGNVYQSAAENRPQHLLLFENCLLKPTALSCLRKSFDLFSFFFFFRLKLLSRNIGHRQDKEEEMY